MDYSVVIPTYNRSAVVGRALASVCRQTVQPKAVYIVDDGSTDKTEEACQVYMESHPRITFHYLRLPENRGVSVARNTAIRQVQTEWVALLDSDDEWLPRKSERQFAILRERPEIGLVHGNELWRKNGKHLNQKNKHRKSGGRIFLQCLPLCVISPSCAMFRRTLWERLGGFAEDFPVCEDYEFWLRLTAEQEVGFVAEPLIIKHGGHDDQLSQKYVAMDLWRVRALRNILSHPGLSSADRNAVVQTIAEKANVLLKGYRKHRNDLHLAEIEDLLRIIEQDQLEVTNFAGGN